MQYRESLNADFDWSGLVVGLTKAGSEITKAGLENKRAREEREYQRTLQKTSVNSNMITDNKKIYIIGGITVSVLLLTLLIKR